MFFYFCSSHRLCGLLVFVVKYKFVSGNVVSENIGPSGRGDKWLCALEDGAINASRVDAVGATCPDEPDDIGLDPLCTWSEYRQAY